MIRALISDIIGAAALVALTAMILIVFPLVMGVPDPAYIEVTE